jgi:hypothetical protein
MRATMIGRRHWRLSSCVACLAVGLAVAGCYSDEGPRQPVSGLVKLDGRPLDSGYIGFFPSEHTDPRVATMAVSMIRNGRFAIERSRGLFYGRYTVAVYSGKMLEERRKAARGPGDGEAVARELLPPRYNTETKLAVEIKDTAIKEIRVDLQSK